MKIQLPKSDMPLIRLEVMCPKGSFQMTLGEPHVEAAFDLPDDVLEDDVEVTAMWLDAGNKPVGNIMVLKEALLYGPDGMLDDENPKDPEPEDEPNEDAPVEADEEVAKSPPSEEVDESPEKEVEVKELPKLRELGDHEESKKPRRCR